MKELNLNYMTGNDLYNNILFMDSPKAEDISFLCPTLDTPGAIWNLDEEYPITLKLLADNHFDFFRNPDKTSKNFFYRNFVDRETQKVASRDDVMYLLEAFDNPTKAMILANNENLIIRQAAEAIVKGAFEDFKINIRESSTDEKDVLEDEEKK